MVGAERLLELWLAGRNRRWLMAQGAVEVGESHYPWMVLLHSTFLLAAPMEVWIFERPLIPPLACGMLLLLLTAMALRYWVVATLGRRWTTRVLLLPGEPRIETGPFRVLRHPNYLAVALEIAALPLVHSAWLTAGIYSLLNACLLKTRIGIEDAALENDERSE